MSFDVENRYLMGFMGSLVENNIVELGPILSRKIVDLLYTDIDTITNDEAP